VARIVCRSFLAATYELTAELIPAWTRMVLMGLLGRLFVFLTVQISGQI